MGQRRLDWLDRILAPLRKQEPAPEPSDDPVEDSILLDAAMALKARWDQRNGGVSRDDMQMIVDATAQMWALAKDLAKTPTRHVKAHRTKEGWFNLMTGLNIKPIELELDLSSLKRPYSPERAKYLHHRDYFGD